MTIITVTERSDRKKHPTTIKCEVLSYDDIMLQAKPGYHLSVLDKNGRLVQVKITSVKSWKRRPFDHDINCKYGLYEYFTIHIRDRIPDITIVNRLYDED